MAIRLRCAAVRAFAARVSSRAVLVVIAAVTLALPAAAQTDVIGTVLADVDATALARNLRRVNITSRPDASTARAARPWAAPP